MKNFLRIAIFNLSLIVFLTTFISCVSESDPVETSTPQVTPEPPPPAPLPEPDLIESGDIVVTNLGNDSIVLLDDEGVYKNTLYDVPTDASISFPSVMYDPLEQAILFTYDSTIASLDAIYSINLADGEVSSYLSNSNLNGTLSGVARLSNDDLVIIEGTNVLEKFLANFTRSGNPFLTGLTATLADINPLASGGFVVCTSGTSNTVRTYTSAGVLIASATSAAPAPSLGALAATGCIEDADGRIIVAYSGGTDAVRVYTNSNLNTIAWTFTDTNQLTTPAKLALRSNGNILVIDSGFHHIVEISPEGGLVKRIEPLGLVSPRGIAVIP